MMFMAVAAIRESFWEAGTDWSLPDAACQEVKCLKAPLSDATRINQARYQILAADTQKVAWKLQYGAKYSVQQSPDCSDDLTKLTGQAHVAQWVDKTNPINNSVVEVFLDPLQELHIRSDPRQHFLCSSDSRGQRCLCQLDSTASPNLGLLARLGRILPTSFRLTEVQVLMERTCPASWIPDILVCFVLVIVASLMAVCIEAVWAASCADETSIESSQGPEDGRLQGVTVESPRSIFQSFAGTTLGFVALIMTTQSLAVLKVSQVGAEFTVWILICSACLLSIVGTWRFSHVFCRYQLMQSCLSRKICICGMPTSSSFDYILAAGLLGFAAVAYASMLLTAESMADAARLLGVTIIAMLGPIMNLLKAVKTVSNTETAAGILKVQPEVLDFKAQLVFRQWGDLIIFGRGSHDITTLATRSEQSQTHVAKSASQFLMPRDIWWHRRAVHKLTGSHSSFCFLPAFALAIAFAFLTTAFQGAMYACSRGELATMQLSNQEGFVYMPHQDRYVVDVDTCHSQVFLTASTKPGKATQLKLEALKDQVSAENGEVASMTIHLSNMTIPRMASAKVEGLRPSQPAVTYAVRFAPKKKLPQLVLISGAGNFLRCIAWSTLAGSQLSIPAAVANISVTMFLTDFVVGVPLQKAEKPSQDDAGQATWTVYTSLHDQKGRSCKLQCREAVDCLESFEAKDGCFFAYHHSDLHEQRCPENLQDLSEPRGRPIQVSSDAYYAELLGCIMANSYSDSGCGPQTKVENQIVSFASISPDWLGATSARMQLKLFMEEFSLQSATDLEEFQLKKGLPLATDVLVHLEAQTIDNKTMHIPTIGAVKDSGDIVIHISEYDPQRLKSLTLSVAPLVAERSFKINWPSLPPEAVLASDFPVSTRCSESLFLQDRYAVCGKEGTWPVQGIKQELWPWTMDFNIPFKIEPMEAEKEATLWTERREHRLDIIFDGVDSPAAWAAEEHGCDLVQNGTPNIIDSLGRSADALCILLKQGCHKQASWNMCSAFQVALVSNHGEGTGMKHSWVPKLLICLNEAGLENTDNCGAFRPWSWESVAGSKAKLFGLVRADRNQGYLHHTPDVTLEDVVSIAADVQASEVSNSTILKMISDFCKFASCKGDHCHLHMLRSWLDTTLKTGSTILARAIFECTEFRHREGSVKREGVFHQVGFGAWHGIATQAGNALFDTLEWLETLANFTGAHCVLQTGLNHGMSHLSYNDLESFLRRYGNSVTGLSLVDLGSERPGFYKDLARTLPFLKNLDHLKINCKVATPSVEREMGSEVLDRGGFIEALSKSSSLLRLEMNKCSASPQIFRALTTALKERSQTKAFSVIGWGNDLDETQLPDFLSVCAATFTFHFYYQTVAPVDSALANALRTTSLPCLQHMSVKVSGEIYNNDFYSTVKAGEADHNRKFNSSVEVKLEVS